MRPPSPASRRPTVGGVRHGIVALICGCVTLNYLDRALLGISLPRLQQDFGLGAATAGLLLSAFSWTYFLAQLPAGVLLDRLGVRAAYAGALLAWSAVTLLHALAGGFAALFGLRLALGLAESPCFPANSQIVTLWCPRSERARAVSCYTAAEYVGLGFFSPLLFWGLGALGWRVLFAAAGALGIAVGVLFWRAYRDPDRHPRLGAAERRFIRRGGGLGRRPDPVPPCRATVLPLLRNRQVAGVCLGQFAVHSTLTFFLTWFPTYLVTARHLRWLQAGFMASLPYAAAFAGVLVAGWWSDRLLARGHSLSVARKTPVILGLAGATVIVGANFVASPALVVAFLAAAFFAQGMSGSSWAVIPEIAPPGQLGLVGGLFNASGNLAGIVTPLIIGLLVQATGSFAGALYYVGAVASVGAAAWIFIAGPVRPIAAPG